MRPACVRLGNEQVTVFIDEARQPTACFIMRVIGPGGRERPLTRDEELALCAAPGTEAEREAASARIQENWVDRKFVLHPREFQPGEIEQVVAQLQRHTANIDDTH